MNFSSFKFFGSKANTFFGRNFNKSTFKMMSTSLNTNNQRFFSLFSNKVHQVGIIRSLNSISKRGLSSIIGQGNGSNLYNNPDLSGELLTSNSLLTESLVGCGFNMTSNIFKMAVLSDYLLLCDGNLTLILNRAALHVGQSITDSASELMIFS
jgi:hypothetical protein